MDFDHRGSKVCRSYVRTILEGCREFYGVLLVHGFIGYNLQQYLGLRLVHNLKVI